MNPKLEIEILAEELRISNDCLQVIKSWLKINAIEVSEKLNEYIDKKASDKMRRKWL